MDLLNPDNVDNIEEQEIDIEAMEDEGYILAGAIIDLINTHNNNKKKYYVVKYAIMNVLLNIITTLESSRGTEEAIKELHSIVEKIIETLMKRSLGIK